MKYNTINEWKVGHTVTLSWVFLLIVFVFSPIFFSLKNVVRLDQFDFQINERATRVELSGCGAEQLRMNNFQ